MKYFTRELLKRVGSLDDDVADEAYADWDQAILRYRRRWRRIKDTFPESVRRFKDEHVCLHDAHLLRIGRADTSLVMVLEKEPPSQDLVVLTFVLVGEPVVNLEAVEGKRKPRWITWEYEEWDLDDDGTFSFEVLLNGRSLRLAFREFSYLIAPPMLPSLRGGRTVAASRLPLQSV